MLNHDLDRYESIPQEQRQFGVEFQSSLLKDIGRGEINDQQKLRFRTMSISCRDTGEHRQTLPESSQPGRYRAYHLWKRVLQR